MRRKTFTLLIAILTFCLYATAQFHITQLKMSDTSETWISYSFPFIESNNQQAANNINKCLQDDLLSNDSVISDPTKIFMNCRFTKDDGTFESGLLNIDYVIELNTSKVLSISFGVESMGIHPDSYKEYYTFNAIDGSIIGAKDLFTSVGLDTIKKKLFSEREGKIKNRIKELTSDKSYPINKEDSAFIQETLKECNEEIEEDNFIIRKNSIVFCKSNCFPHFARPYEANLDVEISLKWLTKYLSKNGRSLLLLDNGN